MTFQEAFKRSIDESGATITEVAAATGVSRDQLYKLYHGRARRTNVDDAVQIAAYFGRSIEDFIGHSGLSDQLELMSLWRSLSEQERQLIRDIAKSRGDAEG